MFSDAAGAASVASAFWIAASEEVVSGIMETVTLAAFPFTSRFCSL